MKLQNFGLSENKDRSSIGLNQLTDKDRERGGQKRAERKTANSGKVFRLAHHQQFFNIIIQHLSYKL